MTGQRFKPKAVCGPNKCRSSICDALVPLAVARPPPPPAWGCHAGCGHQPAALPAYHDWIPRDDLAESHAVAPSGIVVSRQCSNKSINRQLLYAQYTECKYMKPAITADRATVSSSRK